MRVWKLQYNDNLTNGYPPPRMASRRASCGQQVSTARSPRHRSSKRKCMLMSSSYSKMLILLSHRSRLNAPNTRQIYQVNRISAPQTVIIDGIFEPIGANAHLQAQRRTPTQPRVGLPFVPTWKRPGYQNHSRGEEYSSANPPTCTARPPNRGHLPVSPEVH